MFAFLLDYMLHYSREGGNMENTNGINQIKKSHFALAIIMIIVFVAFTIFAFIYYFGEDYSEFNATAREEFEVVGLADGLVPQGFTNYHESTSEGKFFVGGYMTDGSASRVYVVNAETYETEKYFILAYYEDDTIVDYTGHCGGLVTDGNGFWFSGDGLVYYFSYDKINSVENGGQIIADSYFMAPNGADFLAIYNNVLLVGEFHRDGNYDTSTTHHIETSNGTNYAVTFAYDINTTNTSGCGLEDLNPEYAISTPSLVQGMVITNDMIILSTSYSLPSSTIYFYENIINQVTPESRQYDNITEEVQTYILDTPVKTIKAPSMSEEIVVLDGRLYILFENACNKYKYFTRNNLKNVYSIELPTLVTE